MHIGLKWSALRHDGDTWLACTGIALGTALSLILISLGLYQPLGLAFTIQMTSLGYLWLKDRLGSPARARSHASTTWPARRRAGSLAGLLSIVVAVAAWATVAASAGALRRPLWVFVILAATPGLILVCRMFLPRVPGSETSSLVQVLMLAAAIVLATVAVFPYNGGDTWAHLHNAEVVLANGRVQAITDSYRDYPLYPALLSILSASTGLAVAQAARLLNVFIALTCLLLLYALSRQFHTSFESLALILLLLGGKWFVHWATLVVSMTMAMLFFCLLVVILFRRVNGKAGARETIALLLVAGVVPFFHPVGAVAAMFLLVGFWALEKLQAYGVAGRRPANRRSLVGLAVLVSVLTLTQWMYYGDFIFERTVQSLARAIFIGDSAIQLASSNRDVLVYTLDQLNFYGLLGLAGLELMRQIRLKTDRLNLCAGLLGLAFVVFGYATQAVGLISVLPYRWFLFGTLLLVFPASSAFAGLFHRRSPWVRVVAVVVVVIYFFAGLTNTEVNRDRPLYGEEVTQLYELTSSEYAGLLVLQETMQRRAVRIRVDFRLWDYLKYVPGNERVGYWQEIQLDGYDGVFALREAYLRRSFLVNGSASQLERQALNLAQFYDSGDLQLLDHVDRASVGQ